MLLSQLVNLCHFQDPFVALLTNISSRPQASLYQGAEIKAEVVCPALPYPIKASDDNSDLQTRKQDLIRIKVSFILWF